MSAEEECWYRRALDFAWINEGIPTDPKKLANLIGKGCLEIGARVVLQMFEIGSDPSTAFNRRQEEERHKQKIWSEKSAAGGKASAGKRKKLKSEGGQQGGSTNVPTNDEPTGQPNGNISFSFSSSIEEGNTPPKTEPFPINRFQKNSIPATPRAAELQTWLDASATAYGAKGWSTMPDKRKWEDVCRSAIEEDFAIADFLDAIKTARTNFKDKPQYFTPSVVLKSLQLKRSSGPASDPRSANPTARELIALAEKEMQEAV